MSTASKDTSTMTVQQLINKIIDEETEDGCTIVIQDTTLRGYFNQVVRQAVADERAVNRQALKVMGLTGEK